MKTLIIATFFASALCAQYAPSASGSTTAVSEINSKPAWQTGSGAPSALNCTLGKDFYTDTATGYVYGCTITGTPGTWARVSVHPPLVSGDVPNNAANTTGNAATATALAATPTLCTGGQVPTGILANGNATGCATVSVSLFSAANAGVWNGSAYVTLVRQTVYQNTFAVPVLVGCGGYSAYGIVQTNLLIGTTSSPTVVVGSGSATSGNGPGMVTGIVPAGYYYQFADATSGGSTNNGMCLPAGSYWAAGFGVTLK